MEKRRNPFAAALLTFLCTGLGQIYNAQPKKSLVLLVLYALLIVAFLQTFHSFTGAVTVEDGFLDTPLTRRGIQYLVERYVKKLGLDPNVTVHSFRVTALTTARERGADLVDLQDFAGHADPRTTLTYILNRDRLSRSPAYVLKY